MKTGHDVLPPPTRERAVIYCRVSTKEQALGQSLATQEKVCREFCERSGFEVDEVFTDAGRSAKTTERPAFQNMLGHCRKNKQRLSVLVVYALDRFSRDTHDHHVIRAVLLGLGVTLRSATEATDDTPEGRLIEDIMSSLANYENRAKGRRTSAGMQQAVERGRWPFRPPLGYLSGDGRNAPSLVPDPERGALVTAFFNAVATGTPRSDALRHATAMGLRTARGKPLSPQVLNSMLHNRIYEGWMDLPIWGLLTRGDFQPLVSEAVFAAVQSGLARRTRAAGRHHRNHPDFPLRRFVKCARCSKPLTGSRSTGRNARYPYYHCRSCRGMRISKVDLESKFLALMASLQPDSDYMRLITEVVMDVWRGREQEAAKLLAAMDDKLRSLRHRLNQLLEAFLYEKAIDESTYQAERDRLREQIALAEIERNNAGLEAIDAEGILAFAEHVLMNSAQLWREATLEQRRRLQAVLFPEGLRFDGVGFGTPVTCLAFRQLGASDMQEGGMASPTGPQFNAEPLSYGASRTWLEQLENLRKGLQPSESRIAFREGVSELVR